MALESGPAHTLVRLLDQLPDDERHEVTAWLLDGSRGSEPASRPARVSGSTRIDPTHSLADVANADLRRLQGLLGSGEETQLVTIRLPVEQHARLRSWCTRHGFSMASVIRGVVERFLETQVQASEPGDN